MRKILMKVINIMMKKANLNGKLKVVVKKKKNNLMEVHLMLVNKSKIAMLMILKS